MFIGHFTKGIINIYSGHNILQTQGTTCPSEPEEVFFAPMQFYKLLV